MKRKNLLAAIAVLSLGFFGFFTGTHADTPRPAAQGGTVHAPARTTHTSAGTARAQPGPSSSKMHPLFLWKAQGKGTVYLLGSIHMVPKSFYPLPSPVEQAFQKSQELVVEVDETKIDRDAFHQLAAQKGICRGGDDVSNYISKSTSEALANYCEKHGQSITTYAKMKPWLISMSIPVLEMQQRGWDANLGIDHHFMQQAQAEGKQIDQLETADFQLKLMSGFSDELQDKLLLSTLLEAENTDKDAADLVGAWKAGDAALMNSVMTRDEDQYPELKPVMEKLVYERNEGMVQKIEQMLGTNKTYFLVVGAGHMVGDRGIVAMLRKKNYKVDQVSGN